MDASGARDPGRLIALEGPDGSGKSALAEGLRRTLESRGTPVRLVREPGGTAVGERIRAIVLDSGPDDISLGRRTDALLFNAARAQLIEDVVRPALAAGETVISDRTFYSTLAYQGAGGGLDLDQLWVVCGFATGGLLPDLVVLLDIPVEVGLARKSSAETKRFEAHFDRPFHERVRAGFLALAAADPGRWVVVDATAPAHEVLAAVLGAIDGLAMEREA